MKKTTTFLKGLALIVILVLSSHYSNAQTFRAVSGTMSGTSTDSCSSIQFSVNTWLGCINWQNRGATVVVTGSALEVQCHYLSSPICAGAISQPMFTAQSPANLSPGTYAVTAAAYTDNVFANSVNIGSLVVSSCSTTGFDENETLQYSFYPNPSSVVVNIEIPEMNNSSAFFQLIDMKGSLVNSGNLLFNNGKTVLRVEGIPAGNYSLMLNGQGDIQQEIIQIK